MTAASHLQSRRILVVARQSDRFFSYWLHSFHSLGLDVQFFPLDAPQSYSDLVNVTVHRLFVPLRPRLMLRLLMEKPDQLRHFPNYEFHLSKEFHSEFVYPLAHIELPSRPAAPISEMLRRTGSILDIRPAALAKVIRRVKPDLVFSVGLDHAAIVTLRARDRFGPGFPTWLACCWRERSSKSALEGTCSPEMSRMFSSIDFFAYEGEAELTRARKYGLTGEALPFSLPTEFDFDRLAHKMPLPPSRRRTIVIDCSPDRPERAVAAIEALDSCAEILQNYMTAVCRPSHASIYEAVTRIQRRGRFPIMYQPELSAHCAPELLGSSRLYFGVPYLMDGPDLALAYSAAMGAYPIQVCEPGESNWADPGLMGSSAAPSDTEGLKSALTRALTDDDLVDRAAENNLAIARQKFSIASGGAIDRQRREMFDEIFVGPRSVRAKAEARSIVK